MAVGAAIAASAASSAVQFGLSRLFGKGDRKAAKQARANAAKAFSRANALSDEGLARMKSYLEANERYFGNVRENMAAHMNSLNVKTEAARIRASFMEHEAQAFDDIQTDFSKRFGSNITASGLKAAGEINFKLNAAKVRAAADAQAEQSVHQQRAQYLAQGDQQQAALRGQLNQAFQHASGVSLEQGKAHLGSIPGSNKDLQTSAFKGITKGVGDIFSDLGSKGKPPATGT